MISEEHEQTRDLISEEHEQTRDLISEEHDQTRFLIVDEAGKTRALVTEEAGKTRFLISDEAGKTRAEIENQHGQTRELIINEVGQTRELIIKEAGQIKKKLTLEANATRKLVIDQAFHTREVVVEQNEMTRELMIKEAIKSRQLIKEGFKDVGNQLSGLTKQLSDTYTSLNFNIQSSTNLVINEMMMSHSSVMEHLKEINCKLNKKDLYDNLRELHKYLDNYASYVSSKERNAYLNRICNGHSYSDLTNRLIDLMRALEGDQRQLFQSDSLATIEMKCFRQNQICKDQYHNKLRSTESALLQMYFRMVQFQKEMKMACQNNIDVRTAAYLNDEMDKDFESIYKNRKAESCPGFKNYDLVGNGCEDFSSYINQEVKLHCIYPDSTPIHFNVDGNALANSVEIDSIKCLRNGTNYWNINPENIVCIKDCVRVNAFSEMKFTKIGDSVEFANKPGYKWIRPNGSLISEFGARFVRARRILKDYMFLSVNFNRPNFLAVRKAGIGTLRFSKKKFVENF